MTIETEKRAFSVNIVGAGGIASWVLHGLIRPARRFAQVTGSSVTIRIYDSDSVDDDNVHHQNFRPSDVGKAKVDALCDELEAVSYTHLTLPTKA